MPQSFADFLGGGGGEVVEGVRKKGFHRENDDGGVRLRIDERRLQEKKDGYCMIVGERDMRLMRVARDLVVKGRNWLNQNMVRGGV